MFYLLGPNEEKNIRVLQKLPDRFKEPSNEEKSPCRLAPRHIKREKMERPNISL